MRPRGHGKSAARRRARRRGAGAAASIGGQGDCHRLSRDGLYPRPASAGALRDRLALDRLQSAEQLQPLRSGQLARACGLVTVRQRPGTANGVLFMTLEDETGHVILARSAGEVSERSARRWAARRPWRLAGRR
ncbi:hypothetical protein EMIT0158MI4_150103 [Burkholderia ambifaria]